MKSILIRYLLILQSLAHIPATLQTFRRLGFSRSSLQSDRDEASGSHLSEAGQIDEGRGAVAKIARDPPEKDWETVYKENEQQRIETLAASLDKLRNNEEQTADQSKELGDFLQNHEENEAAKFERLRKALSRMMMSDPSIMKTSEGIDLIVKIGQRLEVMHQGRESELAQCERLFGEAQHDFHLVVQLSSLMQAIKLKKQDPHQMDEIFLKVAQAIDSVYISDQENYYYQTDDRIVRALWNAWASLGQEKPSEERSKEEWSENLESALRKSAKKMKEKHNSHYFIHVCETNIFQEREPNNWLNDDRILKLYGTHLF